MTLHSLASMTLVTLLALAPAAAHAAHLKEQPRRHRVVYHLSEAGVDKARFVLGNIHNTISGVGGAGNVEAIELVVHGPALKTFVTAGMDPQLKALLTEVQGQGVVFGACGNTMNGFSLTLDQLPPGAHPLPQGGVVRIMELVEQGYVYLRP
jgi:uncharacterized protein